MASLNKVILIGNLTRDCELRYTPSGSAVCNFGIAVNRKYNVNNEQKDDTCFIDITVYGKIGETCSKHIGKCSSILVEGRLQFDQWEDNQTGAKRSKLSVIAERVQFLGNKPVNQKQVGEYNQDNQYQNEYNQSPQGRFKQEDYPQEQDMPF